jgi:hypothetical protein
VKIWASCASLPATAPLRPLAEVVGGAEGIADAVLAAMANEEDVDVGELAIAERASQRTLLQGSGLVQLARLPMRQKTARLSPAGS